MGILVINCDQLYEQPKSKCLPTSGKNFAHGVECAVQIPHLWGQPEKRVIMLGNGKLDIVMNKFFLALWLPVVVEDANVI